MPPNSQKSRKLSSVCFKLLRMVHEPPHDDYKSCVFTGHAYRPHLLYQCHVLFPLRVLNLKIGKSRRVIKSILILHPYILDTTVYPGHEARYPTLLLTGTMARGVRALESSSF